MRIALGLMLLFTACGQHHRAPGSCDGPCPSSKIDHLIVIVQENHTFDDHFGRYCSAPAKSNPQCTSGPTCCEGGPDKDPGTGMPATVLNDVENAGYDPNHNQNCELDELDNGQMDRFISSQTCGDARNFAYADSSTMEPLWNLAQNGAIADRYFQPIAGASVSNDFYLVRTRFVFTDNQFTPQSIGQPCSFIQTAMSYSDPTIGDLLHARGVSYAWYADGYEAVVDAQKKGACADPPPDCKFGLGITPCTWEPSDVPIEYFPSLRDQPAFMRDYAQLAADLSSGNLPQVAFVKPAGYHSEHAGLTTTLTAGVAFVTDTLALVEKSDYAADTLVLVTYDEGGGFFDHVAPPAASPVDHQPYGTRVPLIAVGPFARKNEVSHATLEHSSIVAFIEWNWLGGQVGQLAGRDAIVGNLGSLLDGQAAGAQVPGS